MLLLVDDELVDEDDVDDDEAVPPSCAAMPPTCLFLTAADELAKKSLAWAFTLRRCGADAVAGVADADAEWLSPPCVM